MKSLSLVVEYSLNFTGVFKVITFSGIVCFSEEDSFDEHIQLIEFRQIHVYFLFAIVKTF